MRPWKLLPKARADLSDIWDYTVENWDVNQADKYLTSLTQTFDAIDGRDGLHREAISTRPGVYRLNIKSHAVLYRIMGGEIVIVRILHQSMDFKRHV
jgi:toxin ParE1/3/4